MRCVFVATSAYLGRIDGETRCAFWSEDPIDHGFDPARLIAVDLALTPSAAQARRIGWEAVQVDDCVTGPGGRLSGTTLGPRWPELQLYGAVWLEASFARTLPEALRPPCPPSGMSGFAYEYETVLYWPEPTADARAGRRYTGHHARILEERDGLTRVAVYPPGTSQSPHAEPLKMWIDLTAPDQCDAGPASLTRIGRDGAREGALFLLSGGLAPPLAPAEP